MQTPEPLPPEPAPRRRFAPWALAIFLLALGLRLLHLWALSNSGLFDLLMGDARRYHDWAMAIAHGAWVGEGVFYQAPLYPYVLGVVYTLFGDSLWAARILQALLGSLACVFVADAGRRLFSRTAGVISGLALAIYAPAIFYDSLIQKSSLDLLLLSLILWLISRLLQGARGTTWLWLGLALGGLCLTRENALIFIPLLLLWLVLAFRQARPQRLRHGVLFLAGVAIVLLPVALRNLAVGGEFHLTTSQSGPNLYIGNNAVTDGVYAPLRFGHGSADYEQADAIELAEAATGRKLSAGEVSRYWAGRAFDFMRTQPGRWLALVGRKFLLAWNSVEAIDTEDLYTYVDKSPVLKIVSLFATFGLIAPLGVLGAWRTWAQRRSLWILYALFATYLLTLIAFFVLGRYRLPMAILLALFAGQGVAAIPELLRARGRALLVPLVAFILTAAVAQLPLISKGSMRAVTEANIGNAFFRAGDLTQTEAHYREAVRVNPRYPEGHYNLAVLLEAQRRLPDAVNEYAVAVQLSPGYLEARNNLAGLLQQLGNREQAIEQYRLALQADPLSEVTRLNLARLLAAQQRHEDAETEYRELLARNPASVAALNGLGLLRIAQRRPAEAIPFYEQAIAAQPDHGDAYRNLAAAYDSLGQPDEGRRQLERAAASGTGSVQPLLVLADEYRTQGDLGRAAEACRQALRVDPQSANAHNGLGVILAAQGALDEAIAEYQRALALDNRIARMHYNLANAYRAKGRIQDTIAELEQAVKLEPNFFEALTNLGLAYALAGRLDEAVATDQRVLQLKPDYAAGHVHLGNALFNGGRLTEARESYERALTLDPQSSGALGQLAWILATHQDAAVRNPRRAVELAERANAITAGRDLRILDTLSVAYAVAQRYADAIRVAQQALTLAEQANDTRFAQQIRGRIQQFRSMQAGGTMPAPGTR